MKYKIVRRRNAFLNCLFPTAFKTLHSFNHKSRLLYFLFETNLKLFLSRITLLRRWPWPPRVMYTIYLDCVVPQWYLYPSRCLDTGQTVKYTAIMKPIFGYNLGSQNNYNWEKLSMQKTESWENQSLNFWNRVTLVVMVTDPISTFRLLINVFGVDCNALEWFYLY